MNTELVKANLRDRFPAQFPSLISAPVWNSVWDDFFGGFDTFDALEKQVFGDRAGNVPFDIIQHSDEQDNIVSTEVRCCLAGYSKEDVNVGVSGDVLTITVAKAETPETDKPKRKAYVHKGIARRNMQLSYRMSGVDKDKIEASFENGELSVILPVLPEVVEASKERKIIIK